MQLPTRLLTLLLAVAVVLQIWTLSRQAELEQQINNLATQQTRSERLITDDLNGLANSIREVAEANRWIAVRDEKATPTPACDAVSARVGWDLQEWAPGSVSRLLYRSGPDHPWQEARTESLGGQSYAASFTIPAKPTLRAGVVVEYTRGKNGMHVAHTSTEAKSALDQAAQYQIVAEGPGLSRSTGARDLAFVGAMMIPAKVRVQVEEGGRYQVEFVSNRAGQNPCARVEGAELRAYVGEQLEATIPLAASGDQALTARWQSQQAISRLELVVRHGGDEAVVPISLE